MTDIFDLGKTGRRVMLLAIGAFLMVTTAGAIFASTSYSLPLALEGAMVGAGIVLCVASFAAFFGAVLALVDGVD